MEQEFARLRGFTHHVVGQDEFADILGIERVWRANRRLREPGGLRVGVGVERRAAEAAIARPEPAAADLVRIGFAIDEIRNVRVARGRRCAPAELLLDFLESTYAAAADLAKWDRAALER